jgi:DNA repair protein SbcC/Rad50
VIIQSLKLENYRRFFSLDLEFPENIIGIIGNNGSGKSTIIEAIGWILYGNAIARTEKQEIRSQFILDNQLCKAQMIFTYGGHEYKIVRSLRGKNATSEAAIYRDGNTEAEAAQDRGVNQYIENLLKLDRQSFLTSVFARQKDLAALSSMKPEERRKSINRLINIDLIDKARDNVRRDRNNKRNYIEGLAAALKDKEELKKSKTSIAKFLEQTTQNRQELEGLLENGVLVLEKDKTSLNELSQSRDLFSQMELEIGKLASTLKESKDNLIRQNSELEGIVKSEAELAKIETLVQDYEKVKKEFEELNEIALLWSQLEGKRKNLQILNDSLEKEKSRCSEFKESAKDLKKTEVELDKNSTEIIKIEGFIKDLQEQIKYAHSQKIMCEKKGKETKSKLLKITDLGSEGECPVCTQTLGDHYNHVHQNFDQELQSLRSDYTKHEEKENELVTHLQAKEKDLGEFRKIKEGLLKQSSKSQEAQKNFEKSKESVENYQAQIENQKNEIGALGELKYDSTIHDEIRIKYNKLVEVKELATKLNERVSRKNSVLSEVARIEKSILGINQEISECKKKQAKLEFDEDQYIKAKENVDHQTIKVDQTKEELSQTLQELARLKSESQQISKELDEQKKIDKEIKEEQETIDYLTALDEHFGNFRLDLAGRIRPLIAQKASQLISSTTNGRYNLINLDQDYNIQLYDGNLPFQIERFSGGEQDLANLCLRIAISQVVAERSGSGPINFIVLDEIFGSQDVERRDLILQALSQLANYFRQIFIITHIEQIRDVLPVIVDVFQKDEQQSEAVLT